MEKLPKLSISYGSSGLEVRAELDESYNCREFTTRANSSQPVMISPWIQFEPANLAEEKLRIVTEIVRRAMVHDDLVARVSSLQGTLTTWQDGADVHRALVEQMRTAWSKERQKYGKSEDFSDYHAPDFPVLREETLVSVDDFRLTLKTLQSLSKDENGEQLIRVSDVEKAFKISSENRSRR